MVWMKAKKALEQSSLVAPWGAPILIAVSTLLSFSYGCTSKGLTYSAEGSAKTLLAKREEGCPEASILLALLKSGCLGSSL